ncbi:hypothetical protein, partial [Cloacibacillus evryensis]|uniref:hypothetical protein n=1 Tax=Cloacibacillus evryensis TaxID=508460 RepID=UPI0026DFFD74
QALGYFVIRTSKRRFTRLGGNGKQRFTRLRGKINSDLSCHAGLDPASSGFRFVPTSIVKQKKPTPLGSGSKAGAAEGR